MDIETQAPVVAINARQLGQQDWPDIDIRPDANPAPRLADGAVVEVVVTWAEVRVAFQGRRFVTLHCQVVSGGGQDGAVLKWHLPISKDRPGGRRSFRVSQSSKFWRAWVAANGGQQPSRRDQMSLRTFKGRLLRVRTRLVRTSSTSQGALLPEAYWHSVIDEVAS